VKRLNEAFHSMQAPKRIITTEKDAARLAGLQGLSDDVRRHLYLQPVRVSLMLDQEESFNQSILGYVSKNSRNSILANSSSRRLRSPESQPGKPRTIVFTR
jgi:tetraacyldisaccharide 4'-kinase